ncbi:MAG: DinB family protein [Gemmatimonadetes bacterium]|nr:DinB family protein [Gemmatimonadota bacterium]
MTSRPLHSFAPLRHVLLLLLLAVLGLPGASSAQAPDPVRDEMLMHFESSMGKFIALARAMPADRYTWSPGEGVMEVGHVFMHVARYNYMYPSANMGEALPAGVELEGMEEVREKERAVRALEESRAWVRQVVSGMTAADLAATTRLYGRDVGEWAVLVQLVAHMNEHLGQSIAYARMNGIVPPWSR